MEDFVIESSYPLTFRKEEAEELGRHLKNRHSVVLIGMKRVGISNFLRFFLYHKDIAKTYIGDGEKHLFIPVDLNDLVEREIFPFWTLTFKRIVDRIEESDTSPVVKKKIESLFLESIQSQDLFFTIDSVRKSILTLVDQGFLPVLFFLRFDRIKDAVNPGFFDNLQGLKDATHQKLSYVFTSFRSLDSLSPNVFTKASLLVFSHDMYIKPARKEDIETIYATYKTRYKLNLVPEVEQALFDIVDGYIQYLQLALISLHEHKGEIKTKGELFDFLLRDERISLQSEELWESLDESEKMILQKTSEGKEASKEEKEKAHYLWDTGFIFEKNNTRAIFSSLFDHYIRQKEKIESLGNGGVEFSKKENLLFTFLKDNLNEICEREKIIEAVWPEVEALGVSDWAIDRLVARVRGKLKMQKSPYEIQTVKTRGYKLVSTT